MGKDGNKEARNEHYNLVLQYNAIVLDVCPEAVDEMKALDIRGWFGANFDDVEILQCNYDIHQSEIKDSLKRVEPAVEWLYE